MFQGKADEVGRSCGGYGVACHQVSLVEGFEQFEELTLKFDPELFANRDIYEHIIFCELGSEGILKGAIKIPEENIMLDVEILGFSKLLDGRVILVSKGQRSRGSWVFLGKEADTLRLGSSSRNTDQTPPLSRANNALHE